MRTSRFFFLVTFVLVAFAIGAKPLQYKPAEDRDWEKILRSLDLDSQNTGAPRKDSRITTPVILKNTAPETPVNPLDPFLAGALGIMPFSSGFYISDQPAKGYVFTAIDVLLTLAIYTSKHTGQGDPDNAPTYYLLMGLNNILDAYLSTQDAVKRKAPTSRVTLQPGGGVQYAMQWTF